MFVELGLEEKKIGGKVDIIWWIDTSSSMGQEAKYLNDNINAFATYIANSKVDYHVVLIGKNSGDIKLCVAPPLGGVSCGAGPKFLPIQSYIASNNGLTRLVQTYPQWKGFLRSDATKNIVAVTDDNSDKTATWFIDQLQKLDPVQFEQTPDVPYGFINHSIVGYPSQAQCATLADVGSVYLELTAKTKGVQFKICETDWAPIFEQLAKTVVETAKPGCDYTVPWPATVSKGSPFAMRYFAADKTFDVWPAPDNQCPPSGDGYVLDDVANPTKVTLCESSCSGLNGGGNVQFVYACAG